MKGLYWCDDQHSNRSAHGRSGVRYRSHCDESLGLTSEANSTLAGSVAYKHVLPDGYSTKDSHRANLYLVTAAVDRIDMLRPIDPRHPENLRLSGHVSYTGSSALEVLVRLDSISRWRGLENDPQAILVARFTMACRDTKTGKAKKIPALVPETPEERALFEMGREQKERKKEMVANSLELQPPNAEEAAKLHTLFVTKREDLFSTCCVSLLVENSSR